MSVSKKQKAELRRLAELAYERELGHHLSELQSAFNDWRKGHISASELSEHIHDYHQGPARQIWSQHSRLEHPDKRVAWGLAGGWLEEREIAADLLALVGESAERYRDIIDG